jgi:hypothetical protein
MKVNKPALYGAKPAHFVEGGIDKWQDEGRTMRFLEKDEYLYAIELGNIWPTEKGFADYEESVPPKAPVRISGAAPVKGSLIYMMGHDKPLSWRMESNDLIIEELPEELPCEHAWTFKIKVK